MQLMTVNVDALIEWLGPEGAKAGLHNSKLTLKDLVQLARSRNLLLSAKPTREETINELVYTEATRIDKKPEELLLMDANALLGYLKERKPSRREITNLLNQFGIQPSSEARKSLLTFAAREISEIGMYQRVAHGVRSRTGSNKS
jgi:hypothetical protein